MDELFYLLLFLFFVLAPLIEGWRKRRSGTARGGQPGQRRVPPASGPQRERPRPQYTEPAGTRSGGRTASGTAAEDVIPDELWELLTGERRRRPEPEPEPEPYVEYEPAEAEWSVEREPAPFVEPDPLPQYQPAGIPERERAAGREARVPAYLPEPSLAARPAPAPGYPVPARRARAARKAPPSPHASFDWTASTHRHRDRRRALGLRGRGELRRAVVLREVLGTPKAFDRAGGGVPGLERPDPRG